MSPAPAGMRIRALAGPDVARAAEIVAANDAGIVHMLERDLGAWLGRPGADDEGYFVAELDGRVVAIQGFQPDPWRVRDVKWLVWAYVDPPWKRRGISAALLAHIEAGLRAAGTRKLYLDVGNEADHREAIAFHLSQGFLQEGYLRDFWQDGEDFLIFGKRLA